MNITLSSSAYSSKLVTFCFFVFKIIISFKFENLTDGNIFIGNAGDVATEVSMSGDATIINDGTLTVSSIGGDAVDLGGALTFSGANNVTFTSTGVTNVILPTSGTLATTDNTMSNSLTSGNIFVGNGSDVATGVAMSGDATIASDGTITISSIGGDDVNLGGALTFSGANAVTFTSTGTTTVTLPTSGIIANQAYVNDRTGTNITTVGTIGTGVWNGTAITGTYLDLASPGNIGTGTAGSGSFTTLSLSNVLKAGQFTTTERDALSAAAGDLIYNTTTNKHQG